MIPDTITDRAVALTFSRSELEALGISGHLTEEAAQRLVQTALLNSGKAGWSDIRIEVYDCGDVCLLLAHPVQPGFVRFRFPDFETLLCAVSLCPAPLPSFLTYEEDAYILLVRRGALPLPAALYEFADAFPCSPLEAAHYREHGKLLIERDAMSVLLQKFSSAPLLFS